MSEKYPQYFKGIHRDTIKAMIRKHGPLIRRQRDDWINDGYGPFMGHSDGAIAIMVEDGDLVLDDRGRAGLPPETAK